MGCPTFKNMEGLAVFSSIQYVLSNGFGQKVCSKWVYLVKYGQQFDSVNEKESIVGKGSNTHEWNGIKVQFPLQI